MLYNLKDIIRLVDKEDRGIAAFNVFGYEDSQAVIEAAESIGRPVIIMANKDAVNHMGVELIGQGTGGRASGSCHGYGSDRTGNPERLYIGYVRWFTAAV